ncbi:MAG: SpoIIE family protein phosphatase, partial [Vulcanimicrobiaceae bacterium]
MVDEFADLAVVAQLENESLQPIASATSGAEDLPRVGRIAEGTIFGEGVEQTVIAAVRDVRPMLVNEVGDQVRAWMMAPLLIAGREFGAVLCYSYSRRYAESDLEALRDLCHRASLALEVAQSFARERRLTQTLQRATLPPNLARVPGATVTSIYLAAAQEEQVGGDWYDAFAIDDHRVIATIGDVTGHGLEASAIMVKLRHALNVVAKYETDPARILDIVEEVVLQRYPEAIATAFVAVIDTKLGTVTYANAGHPHPILRLTDGSTRQLSADGLPVGLRTMHRSKPALTTSLAGVEAMVFYTDGLVEVTRNVIEGQHCMTNALSSDAVPYLSDLAEFVKFSCLRGSLPDDVAVLAISFSSAAPWKFSSSDAGAAREARNAFRQAVGERGLSPDEILGAELIFGELQSNAARHAGGDVQFALEWRDGDPVLHM